MWNGHPDRWLVDEARGGSQAAYCELVRRYQDKLLTIIAGMVPNPEDAQDLLQEVLIKVYRGLGQFSSAATFYTWIYRIAVNTCIDFRRVCRRVPTLLALDAESLSDIGYEPADTRAGADPGRVLELRELEAQVKHAIAALPELYRTAVVLSDVEGHTLREIAEMMQCPVATAKTRVHRGRVELRRVLAPYVERT